MHVIARRAALVRGFTLIELLVTLVVVSIGMLGLVKMQAAAMSETQVSRTRALMTFQAEALAGAMRSNPGYWATGTAPLPQFTVVAGSGAASNTPAGFPSPVTCVGLAASCPLPINIASADIDTWAKKFSQQFPSGIANVACNITNGPTSCDITLSWSEHYVAMNRTGASGPSGAAASLTSKLGNTLVLHVQP